MDYFNALFDFVVNVIQCKGDKHNITQNIHLDNLTLLIHCAIYKENLLRLANASRASV